MRDGFTLILPIHNRTVTFGTVHVEPDEIVDLILVGNNEENPILSVVYVAFFSKFTCFSSDFFIDAADKWRSQAWEMMRIRKDLRFFMITKRIIRAASLLPDYWDEIKDKVDIACTMENQQESDKRLSAYKSFPVCRHTIICEPLLGPINFSSLKGIDCISVGGESGTGARICSYSWVLGIREQCMAAGVSFRFKQTGAKFEKEGKIFSIPRSLQHLQAAKAGINLP